MASLLRQRAVGVRRARPDAPARGQYQRCEDRREGSPLPLACAGPAARRRAGAGRESVVAGTKIERAYFSPRPLAGEAGSHAAKRNAILSASPTRNVFAEAAPHPNPLP